METLKWPTADQRAKLPALKPLRKRVVACLIALLAITLPGLGLVHNVHAGTRTSAINSALNWLVVHQFPDGSYGSSTELQVAPAARALWIRFGESSTVQLSFNWLKNQMDNSTTWFWGSTGEADVPGEVLYSFDLSQNLHLLNLPFVTGQLLSFQKANGGFRGYFDTTLNQEVTSSVDTAEALLGLINAKAISAPSEQSAINYLLLLQNPNGSFNLTSTVASNPLYSLGPEPISITALSVLALKDANFTTSEPHIQSALNYLSTAASAGFNGHVYAAALAGLVFTVFANPTGVSQAVSFILSQQKPDGGFHDIIRFCSCENALDTGWAALALELSGLFGDVNMNGVVNIIDLSVMAYAYGSTVGTPKYVAHADIDGNGVINIIDFSVAAINYGKTADSCSLTC